MRGQGGGPDDDRHGVPSLALLAAGAVGRAQPLAEVAACLDVLPRAVRRELLARLSHERLRGLEICWRQLQQQQPPASGSGDDDEREEEEEEEHSGWSLERETEHEWRLRTVSEAAAGTLLESRDAAISSSTTRKRSFRQTFWEQRFRLLLRARVAPDQEPGGSGKSDSEDDPVRATLHLFRDVVQQLKMHGREVVPRNVALIATLQRLQRLEIHHPEQQKTCWTSLVALIETHPSLAELCFFHGKLSDAQLQQIRLALRARTAAADAARAKRMQAITRFELVSVTIRQRGHLELVALLKECRELMSVRFSACLADFENDELVANALALPRLESLSLEHNHLEDDAFAGISAVKALVSLRHLKLDSNAISVPTLRSICAASLDGFLRLESLELRNNGDIGDAGIHALAPMLASADTTLAHVNVFNCNIGLEGATTLLLALRANTSVKHLDISHNFLGSRFGDLLADLLRSNQSLQSLRMVYVGLGAAGCSGKLLDAIRANRSIRAISLGANRLRDSGAEMLFQAFVERSQQLKTPYDLVELNGNLVTHKGLAAMANTVTRLSLEDSQKDQERSRGHDADGEVIREAKRQKTMERSRSLSLADPPRTAAVWIQDLSLLDNNFPRDLDANVEALSALRTRVQVVHTNLWVGKRNVYDDEV